MAQKVNPTIMRIGVTKSWKTEFSEKKHTQLKNRSADDLNVTTYIERYLRYVGLYLHDYRIYYNQGTATIFISYAFSMKFSKKARKKRKLEEEAEVQSKKFKTPIKIEATNKQKPAVFLSLKSRYSLFETLTVFRFDKGKKEFKTEAKNIFKNKNFTEERQRKLKNIHFGTEIKKVRINVGCKNVLKKNQTSFKFLVLNEAKQNKRGYENIYLNSNSICKNLKDVKKNCVVKKMLRPISLLLKQNNKIKAIFTCVDRKAVLSKVSFWGAKNSVRHTFRFRHAPFYKDGLGLMTGMLTTGSYAATLAKFIAQRVRLYKKQNYFLRYLKQMLGAYFHNSVKSRITGVKVHVKGRINGAPRARRRTIQYGSVPAQTFSSDIDYFCTTSSNKNGSYGIKVWLAYKKL